jgi:hypothetical protein
MLGQRFELVIRDLDSSNVIQCSLYARGEKVVLEAKNLENAQKVLTQIYTLISDYLSQASSPANPNLGLQTEKTAVEDRKVRESNLYGFSAPVMNPFPSSVLSSAYPSANSFSQGLPNRGNTCYINSVLQALKIVFTEFGITLRAVGGYSSCISTLLDSLQAKRGVFLNDYDSLLQKLRIEGWGNGTMRDAKEFFTFLVGKLRTEGNSEIERLFSTEVKKTYSCTCGRKEEYTDTVMVINGIGAGYTESINQRLRRRGQINAYACNFCYRQSVCNEEIAPDPLKTAKVMVVYHDPTKMQGPSQRVQTSYGKVLCFIIYCPGPAPHFKMCSEGNMYDDSRYYSANTYNACGTIEQPYLVFIKPFR